MRDEPGAPEAAVEDRKGLRSNLGHGKERQLTAVSAEY
jgi:hypothetical protein